MRFKKIILGIDPDHLSEEAIQSAVQLCQTNGAKLYAIFIHHICLPVVSTCIPESILEAGKQEMRLRLEKVCQEHLPDDIEWESKVFEGNSVYKTIISATKHLEGDLIVMGAHDRHSMDEVFVGSNTEKVVHHAPCSVLVIKSA